MDTVNSTSGDELQKAAMHFAQAMHELNTEFEFRGGTPEQLSRVQRELPLSPELMRWLLFLAPRDAVRIHQLGNDREFYPPEAIVDRQIGYRWRGLPQGRRGERLTTWPASWVVIGDEGADPIVAETAAHGTPISICVHGTGHWNPQLLAPSLASFLEAQARWVEVCLIGTGASNILDYDLADDLIWDENAAYRPSVRNQLEDALTSLLPSQCLAAWLWS